MQATMRSMSKTVRNMKLKRIIPTECLINNILDKKFQAALLPLNITQSLMGMYKYNINNGFITPNDRVSNIKCCFGAIVMIFIHCIRFAFFKYILNGNITVTNSMNWVLFGDCSSYILTTLGWCIVCILQSSNTVELIIKLQCFLNEIDSGKNSFLTNFKIWNYVKLVFVILIHMFFLTWTIFWNVSLVAGIFIRLLLIPLIIYDLDLVSAKSTMLIITREIEEWNKEMALFVKLKHFREGATRKSANSMLSLYADILKAFRLFCHVYQFTVTQYLIQTFIHILMNLQTLIEFGTSARYDLEFETVAVRLMTAFWNLKNVALLALLSKECENFYKNIKDAEYYCIQILQDEPSSEMQQTCKNVLRHGHLFQKMSVCGLFKVTAALPVLLLGSAVTYSVVLLQFAFL